MTMANSRPMPAVMCLVALFALGQAAAGQCLVGGPASPLPKPGALVGVVMDSALRVLDGAEVLVDGPLRRARTGIDGRFVMDSLPVGSYSVSVRRIGYEMAVQEYQVTTDGGVARFCLLPATRRLLPMVTSAKRLGLGGVIGDSLYKPLAGAEVRVLAGSSPVLADSTGGFFIPLKPGPYTIVVSKAGYGRQIVSVTIPKDSGREVAVWLGPVPRNPNRLLAAYQDMRDRLLNANPSRSALISAEELGKNYDAFFAAQAAIRNRIPPDCRAIIDGGPYTLPLAAIPKEDVAAIEIYQISIARARPSVDRRGSSGGRTFSTAPPPAKGYCGASFDVYVWLK
ncbi:MAG: carboxypeptidase regulatory-like domain-containing protein [Gemmatimonadaceae bacterium]